MDDRRNGLASGQRARAAAAATARLVALPEMRAAFGRGAYVAGFVATRAEIDPADALDQVRANGAHVVLPRVTGPATVANVANVNAGARGSTPEARAPASVPAPITVQGGAPGPNVGAASGASARQDQAREDSARHDSAPEDWDVDDVRRQGGGRPRIRFHLAALSDLRPGRWGIQEPDAQCPEVRAADVAVMIVPGLAFDASGRRLGFGGGYYDEVLAGQGTGRPRLVVGLGYDFQVVDVCPADEHDARVDCVVTDARVIRCRKTDEDAGVTAGEVET
jgi:5-formyltetrahydrofolate cyclo-ligase